MKSQIYNLFLFASLFLCFSEVKSQPKLSLDFGMGFYQPTLEGFDENVAFPSKGVFNRNLLINYGIYYEFFSNARIGYNNLTSYETGQVTFVNFVGAFNRTIDYRIFALETFFRWKPRIELNFTLSPVWGRGVIQMDTEPDESVGDWNELLNSFGDNSPLSKIGSTNAMVKNWYGYAGIIGIRYYLSSRLAIDFKSGFLNNFYKEDNWILNNTKVKGPKLKIDELPILSLKLIYGIR